MDNTNARTYAFQTESVRALETSLAHAVAEIRSELDTLTRALDQLSTQWSGDASAAYVDAQTKWLRSTDDLARLLRASSALAGNTVERQLAARAKVAALWRK